MKALNTEPSSALPKPSAPPASDLAVSGFEAQSWSFWMRWYLLSSRLTVALSWSFRSPSGSSLCSSSDVWSASGRAMTTMNPANSTSAVRATTATAQRLRNPRAASCSTNGFSPAASTSPIVIMTMMPTTLTSVRPR